MIIKKSEFIFRKLAKIYAKADKYIENKEGFWHDYEDKWEEFIKHLLKTGRI